jgi:hypothetical protein
MRFSRTKSLLLCFATAIVLAAATRTEGAVIVGGSGLLDAAYANQLEAWLGEGTIEITRIYGKASGDTATNFHNAVDGQGRTFSVIQVFASQGNYAVFEGGGSAVADVQAQIIGGYNPQSWNSDSTGSHNFTPNDIDRTAFIFNLTSPEVQRQNLIGQAFFNAGEYQTLNGAFFGPSFGGGSDIRVDHTLSAGYAFNWSYGGTSYTDNIVIGGGYYTQSLQFGQIEVFTIRNVSAAVPEPLSLLSWSVFAFFGAAVPALRGRFKVRLPV